MSVLVVILPAILTVIGNIVFYLWIKRNVDNSIEKHKIAFSGIFKERVDIYKEILRQVYDLKESLQQYQYLGTAEKAETIMLNINKFIKYYLVNQLFLSENMLTELKFIREQYQAVFDDFYMHHSISDEAGIDNETMILLVNNYFKAGNKLKGDQPFKLLEETIIREMRIHLRIDTL
jgi:hypothetical protein